MDFCKQVEIVRWFINEITKCCLSQFLNFFSVQIIYHVGVVSEVSRCYVYLFFLFTTEIFSNPNNTYLTNVYNCT